MYSKDLHEIKDHITTLSKEWVIAELTDFKSFIATVKTDDTRSYSHSFNELRDFWYEYLHDKLTKYDFVNGLPEENTWVKRPQAKFWWMIYACDPAYCRPYYDHHCSSKQRLEQMMNMIDDLIGEF